MIPYRSTVIHLKCSKAVQVQIKGDKTPFSMSSNCHVRSKYYRPSSFPVWNFLIFFFHAAHTSIQPEIQKGGT